jgi:hypothetical protein
MTPLVIPPIPAGLCGDRGCVFTARHNGLHSWEVGRVLPVRR